MKRISMKPAPIHYSAQRLVKNSIKENWKNYHYCLGRSTSVELSIGRYLTWLITNMPDHFMNLVVCSQLPGKGDHELIDNALDHFRALNIGKLTWLAPEGSLASRLKGCLLARGLTFDESYSTEMAVDLSLVPETLPRPSGLQIVPVESAEVLRQWIHTASIGFDVPEKYEQVWYDFFAEAVLDPPFHNYLALLDGCPVATSQLFLSAGVAGIYNVTCLPHLRGKGIGAAIARAPLLEARAQGYGVGILQASALGYPVYRKLGFEDFGKLSVYLWEDQPGHH